MQTYTVTTTGEYNIEALAGAGGGAVSASNTAEIGGNGAETGAVVHLTAGEQLEVVVGGQGTNGSIYGGGGGGGTFILANIGPGATFVPLIVAGGGGGAGYVSTSISGNGGAGQTSAGSVPGQGGNGGGSDGGGGGTGFQTVGGNATPGGGSGGTLFNGGTPFDGGAGGFGGGGGGGFNGGGGGGGYSGGGGGQGNDTTSPTGGQGGNSFFATGDIVINSETVSGANTGNGSAILDLVNPTVTLTSTPSTGPDKSAFTITGATDYGTSIPLGAGSTVTLTDNGQTVGTATTAADGTFSASVTLPFVGSNNVIATVVDPNGVSGSSATATYNLFSAVRDLSPLSQEVDRLFYTLLNHAADAGTLALDDAKLTKHPKALKNIASSLIKSAEYRGLHGHQSNAQFVNALYEGAFGRPADAGALAVDSHALAHGLSRQALAVNIGESAEAVAHLGVKPA